jgi:glycosyltransferase involved in cell wall biosynthesis
MKIGVLLPEYNNTKGRTGGQVYDFYLIRKIIEKGIDISIITDEQLKFKGRISILYFFIYLFHLRYFKAFDILIINSRLYPRLFVFIKILRIVNSKLRIISIHHHYNFWVQSKILKEIHKFMELSFLRSCDSFIIPSKYSESLTKTFFQKKEIHLIEIAFDKKIVKQEKVFEGNLLFIGNVEYRKGLHFLPESLYKLHKDGYNFNLNVVGKFEANDSYYIELVEEFSKYGLENFVEFHGRVEQKRLHEIKISSDLFVFPSIHEGYGMVLAEVMLYGMPSIVFNNSAMPYLIKNDINGLLANDRNSDSFYKCLKRVFDDNDFYKQLRENCYLISNNIRSSVDIDQDINSFVNQYLK